MYPLGLALPGPLLGTNQVRGLEKPKSGVFLLASAFDPAHERAYP